MCVWLRRVWSRLHEIPIRGAADFCIFRLARIRSDDLRPISGGEEKEEEENVVARGGGGDGGGGGGTRVRFCLSVPVRSP